MGRGRCFLVVMMVFLSTSNVRAEQPEGFSLTGGIVNHSLSDSTEEDYKTSGISITGDYQWMINEPWTINMFITSSGEEAEQCPLDDCLVSHLIMPGVEGRFWMDQFFMGLHMGIFQQMRSATVNGEVVETEGVGISTGLSLGYAWPNGYLISLMTESASVQYVRGASKTSGLRLQFGYRWRALGD